MENGKELVEIQEDAPVTVEALKDALSIVDDREVLFQKILEVSLKTTTNGDWSDQGGKPYLESSGAEKVGRRFALRFFDKKMWRENDEDERGHYYVYVCTGKVCFAKHPQEWMEVTGTCSSRDKFFGRAHGADLPIQDIDVCNIMKKAETNFQVRATSKFLGLRGLSWEDLAKYGITKDGKSSVSYASNAAKAATTKKTAQAESKSKKPFWTSEYNGKTNVFARTGMHFDAEFLTNLGMVPSKNKADLYFTGATQQIMDALEEEYIAAEETLAIQEEKGGSE